MLFEGSSDRFLVLNWYTESRDYFKGKLWFFTSRDSFRLIFKSRYSFLGAKGHMTLIKIKNETRYLF